MEMFSSRKKNTETIKIGGTFNIEDYFVGKNLSPEERVSLRKHILVFYLFSKLNSVKSLDDERKTKLIELLDEEMQKISLKELYLIQDLFRGIYKESEVGSKRSEEIYTWQIEFNSETINSLPSDVRDLFNNDSLMRELGINSLGGNIFKLDQVAPDVFVNFIANIHQRLLKIAEFSINLRQEIEKFRNLQERLNKLALNEEEEEIFRSIMQDQSKILGLLGSSKDFGDEAIKEMYNKFKEMNEELEKLVEALEKDPKNQKLREKIKNKAKEVGKGLADFIKNLSISVASGIAAWGIALGWFLPLWLIGKMYEQLEKGPFGKK